MPWMVDFHDAFAEEFSELSDAVQDELLARVGLLEDHGPELGRPYADTLYDSRHSNMKELRFTADRGVWRVAYAFDPRRKAILLVADDKAGKDQKRFYKDLIAVADRRFDEHLETVRKCKRRAK